MKYVAFGDKKILYSLSHKSDEFNKWWENFEITDISKMILSKKKKKKPICKRITHDQVAKDTNMHEFLLNMSFTRKCMKDIIWKQNLN